VSSFPRCGVCGAGYGPGFTGTKADHDEHFVRVNKRGQFASTGFDGRSTYCWWFDSPVGADKIPRHEAPWHRAQGHRLRPLDDALAGRLSERGTD
jgi:hypothetical protein